MVAPGSALPAQGLCHGENGRAASDPPPDLHEALMALLLDVGRALAVELRKRVLDRVADNLDDARAVAMSAALGLADDHVDDAERVEVLGRDLHIRRRVYCLRRIAPKDRSRRLGRGHR